MVPPLAILLVPLLTGFADQSRHEVVEEPLGPETDRAALAVEVVDSRTTPARPMPLPVRVIVTASDGSHPDGSGRGTYADGRFFAEGSFTVDLPPGSTQVSLRSGPNYEPLEFAVEAKPGRRTRVKARLHRWFAPEDRGWYAGDNHVHAQHDATAAIRTDLAYTALQARANGLSYLTEAGSNVDYRDIERLSTTDFLFRFAPELRPGPFVGHLNTPGLAPPLPEEAFRRLVDRALPAMAIVEDVHERGGAVIHTHPLIPAHQLHWMGAAEFFSDAVVGRTADALDLDGPATERLWFAALNLGNRVAASGSTDAALGRRSTPSPGDRQVYCQADEFTYPAIVSAIRKGRTFATNGGPVFPFVTLDGRGPGETVEPSADQPLALRAEVHSLHPLHSARLIRRGELAREFDVAGKQGSVVLEADLREAPGEASWFVLRVDDDRGHWAITSPIFVGPPRPPREAAALILEIHNATRFIELRRQFFAHLIATVDPGDRLLSVELLQDGAVLQRFTPEMGDEIVAGKVPVTGIDGEYVSGWIWHPGTEGAYHLQADWPVDEPGWYGLRATTASGRTSTADEIRFDPSSGVSHAISTAHLEGPGTALDYRGYGEEMPLSEIRLPFEGDHWWYPERTWWQLRSTFGRQQDEIGGGGNSEAEARFRSPSSDK